MLKASCICITQYLNSPATRHSTLVSHTAVPVMARIVARSSCYGILHTTFFSFRCTRPSWHRQQQCLRSIATHTFPHQAAAISVLPTAIDRSAPEYLENARQMDKLLTQLSELHSTIAQGGPQKAREKHIARGKMLPREYVGYSSFSNSLLPMIVSVS